MKEREDQMRIDYDNAPQPPLNLRGGVGAALRGRPEEGQPHRVAPTETPVPLTDIESRVFSLIQRGRGNAISMSALAEAVGIATRELQDVIKHLIEDHGVLIASATGKNHGYYYPVTEDELISARAQIIHRIQSLARRLRAIDKEAFEEIFGQGRMEI